MGAMPAKYPCHDASTAGLARAASLHHSADIPIEVAMKRSERNAWLRGRDGETNRGQQTIDMLIDEMGEQSFPASDPPAWGAVSSRLDQARRGAQAE